mgnify:CR=1 FL=1
MVRMTTFPIWQDDNARANTANDTCESHARCDRIFEPRIGPAQILTPSQEQMAGRCLRFRDTQFRRTASGHVARRQIESALALFHQLDISGEIAATELLLAEMPARRDWDARVDIGSPNA